MVNTRRTVLATTACIALVAAVTSACVASAHDAPARPAAVSGGPSAPDEVRPIGYTVVKRLPHDPTAYTQGVEEVTPGTVLESTGQVGRSFIGLVDVASGAWLKKVPHPMKDAFGEGSTILNGTAYYLSWQHKTAVALDPTTFVERKRFTYEGEGWGLTNDGHRLIMSNGSNTITFRDPATFAATSSINVTMNGEPVSSLNELEYVGGTIFANIYLDSRIVAIDATTGKVTGVLDAQTLWDEARTAAEKAGKPLQHGEVPNGVAFLSSTGNLLLTGKDWPLSFEVALDRPLGPRTAPATPKR